MLLDLFIKEMLPSGSVWGVLQEDEARDVIDDVDGRMYSECGDVYYLLTGFASMSSTPRAYLCRISAHWGAGVAHGVDWYLGAHGGSGTSGVVSVGYVPIKFSD